MKLTMKQRNKKSKEAKATLAIRKASARANAADRKAAKTTAYTCGLKRRMAAASKVVSICKEKLNAN